MISKTYEGNKSLKGLTHISEKLKEKIRKISSGEWNEMKDENITMFAGDFNGRNQNFRFFYLKHDITVNVDNGMATVSEFDYYGGYFWSYEAREIGKFKF